MVSLKQKDIKVRKLVHKLEKQRLISRLLLTNIKSYNKALPLGVALINYKYFKRNVLSSFSLTKMQNRCILSNRGRGVYKNYNSSRFILRNFIQFGFLPGYKKAVW